MLSEHLIVCSHIWHCKQVMHHRKLPRDLPQMLAFFKDVMWDRPCAYLCACQSMISSTMTIKLFLTGNPLDQGRYRLSCLDGHRVFSLLRVVLRHKRLQFTPVYSSALYYSFWFEWLHRCEVLQRTFWHSIEWTQSGICSVLGPQCSLSLLSELVHLRACDGSGFLSEVASALNIQYIIYLILCLSL